MVPKGTVLTPVLGLQMHGPVPGVLHEARD